MKNLLPFSLCLLLSCQMNSDKEADILYQSDAFTLTKDKVIQGDFEAQALSSEHIISNYHSPASESYSRLIRFKFSINEKDNEMNPGQDHWLIIGDEHESPVLVFGQVPDPQPEDPGTFLPPNYTYTFRVDMSPVIRQFEEKGFYETYDGTRVAKDDFKGFYVAGGSEPLSWDFVNLDNKGLKLRDSGSGNIYTLTLSLNPYDEEENQEKEWKRSLDLSQKPVYRSDQPIVDALFNLSLEEAIKNIEPDSTFRTGAKWGGVWTRDISYSILLAFAYHEPKVARISLMKKVKRGRIIQDTGSGGAWPVSSDRTTWALAAWEIYKVTGDLDWLKQSYEILKNTLDDDWRTIGQTQSGLFRGESSFLDWREQTYPKWMSNMDIYHSENLGTNVVHYQAHRILVDMAGILDEPAGKYQERADLLKSAINEHLWMPDKGYYGQYLYGRPYLNISPRFEALGEALAVLFDVADAEQAVSIFEHAPVTAYGTTCIYPQIPGIPPYHNNGIWPFVQSYWNLAAAKTGHEQALVHGLAAIYRAGGLFLTNYENFVAQTGDFNGTEINSDRMLWSMAGNLAMVHRVFMGLSFETGGIRFHPVIPKAYDGTRTLSGFRYRDAVLDISVKGFGNAIDSILMDGAPMQEAFFPAGLSGKHRIEIRMNNRPFQKQALNLVPNHFTLPDPLVSRQGDDLIWEPVENTTHYLIYKNGTLVQQTVNSSFPIPADQQAVYKVAAVDKSGWLSFTSEPVWVIPPNRVWITEMEDFKRRSDLPFSNYTGKGFVEISEGKNETIRMEFDAPAAGTYLLDFRYSNGSGPWNTDNKCAIRSLWVNRQYAGALVMPQRGTDEWSDWGYSNPFFVELKKGSNRLKLTYESWNTNMNGEVNRAMLDHLRVIRW